jgi:dipeptidyl aminopeptidase/acylaminoacyl peptidase
MKMQKIYVFALLLLTACWLASSCDAALRASTTSGVFENHADVGIVLHPGALVFDSSHGTYTVSGSGVNMWSTADAFHFVWKQVTGDVALAADVSFVGNGGNEHRKAVLIVRQNLDADSVYADVALHGNSLTALQYRDEKGAATHEVQSNVSGPRRLRIEKRGDFVYLFLGDGDQALHYSGASIRIPLRGTYYVGIGVCSHDKDVVEKATFANVHLAENLALVAKTTLYSTLERVAIDSTDRSVVYVAPGRSEAPNWLRDGTTFLFNRGGRLYRLPVAGGDPTLIDTGFAIRCNNDHGVSPDQTLLAISDQSQENDRSNVYIVPTGGGVPRRITVKSPSYWHGWSPDGKTLAFVGERNGDFDIYTIPVDGGEETQLTTAKGLDDGPEYSPDGRYIYFNSERTGHMQIWRMRADGSEQEQIVNDAWNDWFPHISPDGKWIVFLSYDADVKGHLENKDVMLRMMPLIEEKALAGKLMSVKVVISVVAKLFGGQGTINVPSWSPDSKEVAFVSYALVPDESAEKIPDKTSDTK